MNSIVRALAVALLAAVASACPAACWDGGPSIGYSVVPRADYLRWDNNIGLENAYLYGGELGADLDRLVALRGYFLTNSGVGTDLARISTQFIDQDIGLTNYGVDVILNLNQGQLVPFVRCGGGILRFDPDSGEVFNQIALRAGGGLRYEFAPGFHCEASVEDLLFRVDRTMLSGHDPEQMATSDPDRNKLRSNLAVSVGVGVNLGAQPAWPADAEGTDRGIGARLAGGGWTVEAFSGRLRFDDPSDLGDREVVGGRLGTSISPNLNVCGYYWRGMTKGYETTEDLQSYGGEAQFFLGRGRGAVPYLLMGAGKLDFLSDFRDLGGRERSDKALLILGAGVGLMLSDNVRLAAEARDYMLSEGDFDEVGSPDQLRHSLAITGSLGFVFGARRHWERGARERGQGRIEDLKPSYQSDNYVTLPVPSVGEIYVRYGEPGGVTVVSGQEAAAQPAQPAPLPSAAPMPQMIPAAPAAPAAPSAPAAPAPAGAPAVVAPAVPSATSAPVEAVDREAVRRMIDEELALALRAAAPAQPESAAAPDQTEALLTRIADALDQRVQTAPARPTTIVIEQPQQVVPVAPEQAPQPAQAIVIPPSQPGEPGRVQIVPPAPAAPVRPHIAYTYTGVNIDDPAQWVFGARFDAAPIRRGSSIWIVPEVGFGLFNKGSLMLVANAQYDFDASVKIRSTRITPYLYGGAGLLHFGKGAGRDTNEGVVNLGYGLTFNIYKMNAYVEHQGVDLFSLHRLILGLRWATSEASD
jgi:hypothetical protein